MKEVFREEAEGIGIRECLTGGFLPAVSHKSFVTYQVEQQAAPRTEVIMWDRLESPLVNILFMTKLLSLDPLSWDMDCLLTLWPLSIPSPLGNTCCMFGFLIFIIVERNFLDNSLYILTERSLKHLCFIRAWVPMSVYLSVFLSLLGWFSGAQRPVLLTLLPGLLRLSWEGTLCLHPPPEDARCLRERHKSCVKDFIGFLHKPGSINLFLSFTFLSSPLDCQVLAIKGPQQYIMRNTGLDET